MGLKIIFPWTKPLYQPSAGFEPAKTRLMTAIAAEPKTVSQENPMAFQFLKKWETEFTRLFHAAPKWEHYAITVVNFAAPFAESLLGMFEPALLPVALPIINKIKADLATVSVLTGDGAAPETVSAALTSLQTNLKSILDLGEIKDTALIGKITSTVDLISGEIQAVIAALPVTAAATPTPAP